MPRQFFYPLTKLKLGVWNSELHCKDQLFLMLLEKKIVYVVVYPAREISQPNHDQKLFISNLSLNSLSWQRNKKQILKLFGSRNPFSTKVGNQVDFFGVVTFELQFDDIGGFDCSNSLIEGFSRFVFESNLISKKSFESLEDFFTYYKLQETSDKHYEPTFNRKEGRIQVKTAWKTINELDQ